MAAAYIEADLGALHRLADLVELNARRELNSSGLAEIRQLEDRFGLSPRARQVLQWQVLAQGAGQDAPAASAAASSSAASSVRRLRAVDPRATAS